MEGEKCMGESEFTGFHAVEGEDIVEYLGGVSGIFADEWTVNGREDD